ncbi:hypothetical protein ACIPZ5_24845 [Pseudomonas sp. NPDC089428]|uniref:hypothetical protein n=1 Tax=Pseudomonas sp. NPDC089428 TaxID=3364467 RepID=UPI00382621C2
MNPKQPDTAKTAGTITVYTTNDDHRAYEVPAEGSDWSKTFSLSGFKARQIHMIGIPSAATITLESRDRVDGKPKWWVTFKTTHSPSVLDKNDIDQYVNRNAKNSFIRTALGFLVVDKSEQPADRDTLGEIIVKVSAPRREPNATAPVAAADHGEQP